MAATGDGSLLGALRGVVGPDAVLYDEDELSVYEYDGALDRARPDFVVFPRTAEEVAEIVRVCNRYGVPFVARGAGTGLSGGAIPVRGGVLVVLTRMNRILQVDYPNRVAVVEPGVINITVTEEVAPDGYYYAPDPSSQKACTIGGNVAENSGGPHCLAYGVTTNHVLALDIVLPDGTMLHVGGPAPDWPGYDLTGVLTGSEGTLAIFTRAWLRLMRQPEAVRTFLAIFDRLDDASETVSDIIAHGIVPAALEMMDRLTIEAVEPAVKAGYPPEAEAVLLIEVEGLREAVDVQSELVRKLCQSHQAREIREAETPEARERLWAGRKGALGALGRLAPNYCLQDGVVPRTKLPWILRRVAEHGRRYGFRIANVFHAGDGNLHPCILFDEREPGATERVLECAAAILKDCVDAGGTITGEHGVGTEKKNWMPWLFSEADLDAMARLKRCFNPKDLLNPGKVFPTTKSCVELSGDLLETAEKLGIPLV